MAQRGKLLPRSISVKAAVYMEGLLLREQMRAAFVNVNKKYMDFQYILTFLERPEADKLLKNEYDLIILDISGKESDILDIARKIRKNHKKVTMIFLADNMDYVKEAFKLKAYRYLCKKKLCEEMKEALSELLEEDTDFQSIGVMDKGIYTRIFLKDIYYIESLGDEAAIYSRNSYVAVKLTLNSISQLLGSDFYRCHNSYIVNLGLIIKITSDTVILSTGKSVPIAVRRKSGLKEAYIEYLKRTDI